jgi:hypothetical protein
MKKTYKANKNHPELKEGTIVKYDVYIDEWVTNCYLELGYTSPECQPEWYDEVVEEPTASKDEETQGMVDRLHRLANHLTKINQTQTIYNKETTISDNEMESVLNEICEEEFVNDGYYKLSVLRLATYLAKLEKRISK